MKEYNFEFDEKMVNAMTAAFVETYKSRVTDKSLNEIDYADDIVEAYVRGIHNGCMLLLSMMKENTEVNADDE